MALLLMYLPMGIVPYLYFGDDIYNFGYGNILLSYEFAKTPIIVCNCLVTVFIVISNILKYKPAKEVLTCLLRKSYRDSGLWNGFIITCVHFLQTFVSCMVVSRKYTVYFVCYIISGLSAPIIIYIFPFLSYHMTFYFNQNYNHRRRLYLFFMFTGILFYVITICHVIVCLFEGVDLI